MGNNIRRIVLAGVGAAGLVLALSGCTGGSALTQDALRGEWTSQEQGRPHLDFDGSGEVKGSDGCNGIMTSYTIEGDHAVLAEFAQTLMACEDVDDWLGRAHEVAVDGNTMTVKDSSGAIIGQLERGTGGA